LISRSGKLQIFEKKEVVSEGNAEMTAQ